MSQTMLAAVLTQPQRFAVQRVARPEPAAGQVRIKVEGCGICGSNGPTWEGREWFEYPLAPGAPGHEGWGVVDALGDAVKDLAVGDRVAYLSNSALAEYDAVPVTAAVRLPASLRDQPVPGEPLGCAMNIYRRSDVSAGQTVAIVGVGFLGALVAKLAKNAGARVIALGRRPYALEVAKRYGADHVRVMDDHWKIIEDVKELTGGVFCDRVIEVTGEQWPLDLSAELTRERGKLIIAGYHQDGPRQVNMQLWNWRGLDVVNAHEREQSVYLDGMRAAIDAVASGAIDPGPLYTHRFGLDAVDEAFRAMKGRPEGFMKALVTL